MIRLTAILAAIALPLLASPALAQIDEEATSAPRPGVVLTDTVWVRSDSTSDLPGSMHIFLSKGTLVSGSCWEPYRLSNWRMDDETTLSWEEDGMP